MYILIYNNNDNNNSNNNHSNNNSNNNNSNNNNSNNNNDIYIYIKCISTNRIPKRFCVICACVCMLVLLSGRIKAALWSSMGFCK